MNQSLEGVGYCALENGTLRCDDKIRNQDEPLKFQSTEVSMLHQTSMQIWDVMIPLN